MTERSQDARVSGRSASEPSNAVSDALAAVDAHPTPGGYARAARTIAGDRGALEPLAVALLASYTIDTLVPYLVVESARREFALDTRVGAYHSVLQELLDPDSGTARQQPDVVVIAQQLDDVSPALVYDYLGMSTEARSAASTGVVGTLVDAMRAFRGRHSCTFIVHNFALPAAPLLGLAEPMSTDSRTDAVRRINDALAAAARSMSDVVILDFDLLCATVGYGRWRDERGWYLGRAPLSAALCVPLAREHARILHALRGTPRKCLVLDLDNTLWGGVVGEDGLEGIHIGTSYPGNVFLDFQRVMLQLHARGVLLALNSKNNESDVLEVFAARTEMLLGPEHFAAMRINWSDKPANMRSIADELNIGVDSLVFFDDSPGERARMRQALPEVLTLEVPPDPMGYVGVLEEARPFERMVLSDEDRRRGSIERQQRARKLESATASSLQEFLQGLEMRVTIRAIDAADAPRVVDLLRKTNQFNVTTRRHTAAQLDAMLQDSAVGAFSVRASDRFGDHGLVGVALARVEGTVATIDSFLLSCRVIGRGVESALLVHVVEWARAHGAGVLVGAFVATPNNAPAADLYSRHGFRQDSGGDRLRDGEGARWTLDLAGSVPPWPAHIARDLAGELSTGTMNARVDARALAAVPQ